MTLDEAIQHCEEVAKQQEEMAWEAELQEEYEKNKSCKECADDHRQLAEWLKELKKLREQTRWIPVSERSSEEEGRYYVTRHDYVTQTDFTDILWYERSVWWNRQSIGDYAVIAWMPLPKPYQSEVKKC